MNSSVEVFMSTYMDKGQELLVEPVLNEDMAMTIVTKTHGCNDKNPLAESILGGMAEINNGDGDGDGPQEIDLNSPKEGIGGEETAWYICAVCFHSFSSLDLLITHKRQVHAIPRTSGAAWRISENDLLTSPELARMGNIRRALESFQKSSPGDIKIKPVSALVRKRERVEASIIDQVEFDFSIGRSSKNEMSSIVKVERTEKNSKGHTKAKSKVPSTVTPKNTDAVQRIPHIGSPAVSDGRDKSFSCTDCGKRFTNKKLMRIHRSTIHRRGNKFQCPDCPQKFRLPSELKNHSLIHSGKRLFGCDICGRQFARRCNMLCHRLTHSEGNATIHLHTSQTITQVAGTDVNHVQTLGAAVSKLKVEPSWKVRKPDIPENPNPSINEGNTADAGYSDWPASPQYDDFGESDFGYPNEDTPAFEMNLDQTFSPDSSQQVDNLVQVKEEPIEMDIADPEAADELQDPSYVPPSLHNSRTKSRGKGKSGTKKLIKRLRSRNLNVDPEEGDNSSSSGEQHSDGNDTSETKLQVKKEKRGDTKRNKRSKEHKSRKCVICDKEFSKPLEVSDHQVNEHGGIFIFECELCNSRYISINDLISHEKLFHKEEELEEKGRSSTMYQELLGNKSENGEALKKFIKSLEEAYKCPKCYKSFSKITRIRYNEHVQYVHIKRVTCECCGWFGGTRSELKNHINTVHANEKDKLCPHCGKSFVTSRQLQLHSLRHKNYQKFPCEICGKLFNMRYNLKTHQATVHNIGEKRFQCHLCPRAFCFNNELKAHIIAHSNPRYKVRTELRPKIVPCPYCDNKFTNRDGLRAHLRNLHRGDMHKVILKKAPAQIGLSTEELTCKYCRRVCKFASQLRQHLRVHTNERPFACDVCGKRFKRSLNLKEHQQNIHMNESRNSCDICGLALPAKEIRLHKMTIHGLASRCEVCGKLFSTAKLLKQHSAVHLSDIEKPFRCELCGKGFCQKQQVQIHQKSHFK